METLRGNSHEKKVYQKGKMPLSSEPTLRVVGLFALPRNVFANDCFSEDSSSQDVSDCSVGGLPHLLQLELLHPGLVRGDGGTLDAHVILQDGVGTVNCHLKIGPNYFSDEYKILKVFKYYSRTPKFGTSKSEKLRNLDAIFVQLKGRNPD